MAIAEWIAAVQPGGESQNANPAVAWWFVYAIVAAVLALVVMVFIRTSVGRSSRR